MILPHLKPYGVKKFVLSLKEVVCDYESILKRGIPKEAFVLVDSDL